MTVTPDSGWRLEWPPREQVVQAFSAPHSVHPMHSRAAMSIPSEDPVTRLLAQILELPQSQRAELANQVLRSLPPSETTTNPDWHTPWTDELERRRREIAECARSMLGKR